MKERMNKQELIELIESLKIDKEEFWVVSSGALVLRGIYPDAGDLDIAVTEKGLRQLMENYNLIKKDNGFFTVTDKVECVLETKEQWKIEKVDNYNLENIKKYYNYLTQSEREKDKLRIPIVEEYIRKKYIED